MRLLVTGGAGFIGSNFTRHALTAGHDVVVYDALTSAGDRRSLGDMEGRFTFVHAACRLAGLPLLADHRDALARFVKEALA
ncbi:MAG: NAD-dependent epimerase/dehydratase family protein [Acidimicrobiales bacterium]